MNEFNRLLNGIFDLWFLPLERLPETIQIGITALPVTLFALLVFRYASNQQGIVHAKNQIAAYLLELRLFNATLGITLRTQGNIFRSVLAYLRHTLPPLAIMLLPMMLVIVQLESRFGFHSLAPCGSALLTLVVGGDKPLVEMKARLSLPTGLSRTTPALRVERDRKIIWRITANQAGVYQLGITIDGVAVEKRLLAGSHNAHASPMRYPADDIRSLLYPAEAVMEISGQIISVHLDYPRAGKSFAGLSGASWVLFGFTMLLGLLLRRFIGVTF